MKLYETINRLKTYSGQTTGLKVLRLMTYVGFIFKYMCSAIYVNYVRRSISPAISTTLQHRWCLYVKAMFY